MMDIFLQIAERFGLPAAILAYFIFRDYCSQKTTITRESRMSDRIQSIEDYQRTKLEGIAVESMAVSKASTIAIDRITQTLITRPCVAEDMKRISDEREREAS